MTSELQHSSTPELRHASTPAVIQRLYILTAVLLVGFSMIWLLPKSGDMKPSRLGQNLPLEFDSMRGKTTAVTGAELDILAKDTEFERAQYFNMDEPGRPPVEVSVVFSGKDLNNSIHRPERCLRSQGWNFVKERKVKVKGAMPDGSDMPLREIVCVKPVQLKSGEVVKVKRVQYYTFFGHTVVTEDHYGRTLQDMKDRLFRGYDQQWAYATFSMPVYDQSHVEAGIARHANVFTLEESEAILAEFIQKLAPHVVK